MGLGGETEAQRRERTLPGYCVIFSGETQTLGHLFISVEAQMSDQSLAGEPQDNW